MSGQVDGIAGLVTTREAGKVLGVKADTITWRIRTYGIPVMRVGRVILVSLAALRQSYSEPPSVTA